MKMKNTLPLPGVMDLYSAELHECHRILDSLGIPQSGFEEQLSISQRLATLATLYKALKG